MKSGMLLNLFAVVAVLSVNVAQAGDSCILSSLSHSIASADASDKTGSAGKAQDVSTQDVVATIAPIMGSMAKEGIHTAASVMRVIGHEANHIFQE